ncbi:MAG: DUF3500 domain-containing protein [Planctomycetes bacterium]|nr:DUF3500 domain-containing protein [Planctomycetota bacterium]MBL7044871.1 DUF3500 domain-containing protein [Pirellulaceae bacterium]
MSNSARTCPDCAAEVLDRRDFLRITAAGAAATAASGIMGETIAAEGAATDAPETQVKRLYNSLSDEQKRIVCFGWDHQDARRGLLRTRVGANWHITEPAICSEFFTAEQQRIVRDVFDGIIQPEWHDLFDKQMQDDTGGFGNGQNIAIFGKPGDGKFEFVMTGRHMTLRCDGNSAEHVAFGGPIFYGHAADGFTEKPNHPGNVFWEQAVAANVVHEMLDGKQRKLAHVAQSPKESQVAFRGTKGELPGIPVAEMSTDQREQVQRTLQKLIEPYRQSDRDEVVACLKAQGGLDKCHLAFYTDKDLGDDGVWDNWRLEGPSFVWYFRGSPHVHVWVNVANDPSVKLNA